jgi:hypothetical protein
VAEPPLSLGAKLGLALVSVVGYLFIVQGAEWLDTREVVRNPGRWFHVPVGFLFGALVMGPYASRERRAWRISSLCAAGALIYFLSIRFVTDGPLGMNTLVSFVAAGSIAALLVGLAVALLAPRRFAWKLVPLMLVAGAAGGAAFEFELTEDAVMLAGHAAWQVLVCLALYFSFSERST